MSTLVTVPKQNGGLTRTTSNRPSNFPTWTSWLDDFFNRDLPSVFTQNFNTGISLPMVNIRETADAYFVEMAIPGLSKSDFQVNLDNHVLFISADKEREDEQAGENYTRREFGYSSFKRSFTLPETVDDEKINAHYKDGILSIHLPKKEEARRKPSRVIKIS